MGKKSSYLFILKIILLNFVTTTSISAATIYFTGSIESIVLNNGSSIYSSTNIGDIFSGSTTYGDSSADADGIIGTPTTATYLFTNEPYGGVINGSSITTSTDTNSQITIKDNASIGNDYLFINNLYEPNATTSNDIVDLWNIDSTGNSFAFGLLFYSLDTSLFSNLNFKPQPPILENSDFSIFYIKEVDSLGATTYLAIGKISSVTTVPLPASIWFLIIGFISLVGFSRHNKQINADCS